MRVILVPVADRPECARALKTAFVVAGRFGADSALARSAAAELAALDS